MTNERLCPDCGDDDPANFSPRKRDGRRCRRCMSIKATNRYRERQIALGRQPRTKPVTKYRNTEIWLKARAFGLKPSQYLDAMKS